MIHVCPVEVAAALAALTAAKAALRWLIARATTPRHSPRHSGRAALVFLVLAAVVAAIGCGGGVGSEPTGPSSGDSREEHVVAETARFASLLGVRVRGVVTDEVYMVPAARPLYPGEKVPAAGWYSDGVAYYYRPVVLERTLEGGTALAAHEVCHAKVGKDEAEANRCAAGLS